MDIAPVIDALGGGVPAVAIVALGFLYWQERKRNDKLVDRSMDNARDWIAAISELTRKVEGRSE